MKETTDLILPPRLKTGDTIGLVSPAGPVKNAELFGAGVSALKNMGFKVRYNQIGTESDDYLAASDEYRAQEFNKLWADTEVNGLMAVRGGYGSLRMVKALDMGMIRNNPKILVGFSDITVLLTAIMKETGLVTFHGPVLTTLDSLNDSSRLAFFEMLTSKKAHKIELASEESEDLKILKKGKTKGRLIGGNLTNLVHLISTPYELNWDGSILFIEDVGEAPYRIDRMLTHLAEAGRLEGLAGLLLGSISEGDEDKCDTEACFKRVMEILEDVNIPIWGNFPVGHGVRNHILPLGVEVEMNSEKKELKILRPCLC